MFCVMLRSSSSSSPTPDDFESLSAPTPP
ncbi:hypothetical protein LINPERHAP1_LOCUS6500 [Linum perenne]